METVICLVYIFLGAKANSYLKYHILGVQAEIYSDTFSHFLSKGIWGAFLGWITIPIAILHKILFNRS